MSRRTTTNAEDVLKGHEREQVDTSVVPEKATPAYENDPKEWLRLINSLILQRWVQNEDQLKTAYRMYVKEVKKFLRKFPDERVDIGTNSIKIAERDTPWDGNADYAVLIGYDLEFMTVLVSYTTSATGKGVERTYQL